MPLKRSTLWRLRLVVSCLAIPLSAGAQTAKQIVQTMMVNERTAAEHKSHFTYISNERADRTHGQMWTERIVETPTGRVHDLLAVNGAPVSAEVAAQERGRLAADAAHPEEMAKREAAEMADESHARQMLDILGRGFLLENLREEGSDWHIDFRPDAAFSADSIEEKVLHSMSGYLLVDRKSMRLHHVEGRLPADVSIGFGLLATIKAGSNFMTTKEPFDGQWRTVRAISDIRGKAALFKSLSRSQDVTRGEFRRVPDDLSVAQAVTMAENQATH